MLIPPFFIFFKFHLWCTEHCLMQAQCPCCPLPAPGTSRWVYPPGSLNSCACSWVSAPAQKPASQCSSAVRWWIQGWIAACTAVSGVQEGGILLWRLDKKPRQISNHCLTDLNLWLVWSGAECEFLCLKIETEEAAGAAARWLMWCLASHIAAAEQEEPFVVLLGLISSLVGLLHSARAWKERLQTKCHPFRLATPADARNAGAVWICRME